MNAKADQSIYSGRGRVRCVIEVNFCLPLYFFVFFSKIEWENRMAVLF